MAGEEQGTLTAELVEHLPKFKVTVRDYHIAHYGQPTRSLVILALTLRNI